LKKRGGHSLKLLDII